jgi:hypothetical protein
MPIRKKHSACRSIRSFVTLQFQAQKGTPRKRAGGDKKICSKEEETCLPPGMRRPPFFTQIIMNTYLSILHRIPFSCREKGKKERIYKIYLLNKRQIPFTFTETMKSM